MFFFLPFHHVGGAEKVHARIVACVSSARTRVFFTHKSVTEGFLEDFKEHARILKTVHLIKFRPLRRLFSRSLATYINSFDKSVVVGCNTDFFYEMLPLLGRRVRCIDIIHGLGSNIELSSLPYVPRLDRRVVVCEQVRRGLCELYDHMGLPRELSERIAVIGNYAEYPSTPLVQNYTGKLTVLYVGRGSDGKRVHLLGRLAQLCRQQGLDIRCILVGGLEQAVREEDRAFCVFIEEKRSFSDLAQFYREAHVFVMASVREGLPLGLLDAMAFGLVPMVTAVGGIPEHVIPGRTGYLIDSGVAEEQLLAQMFAGLTTLEQDRSLLAALSVGAASHAREHFRREGFEQSWCDLILGS